MNKTTLTLNLIGDNACKVNDVTSNQQIYLFNDLPEISQYADKHHGKMPEQVKVYLNDTYTGTLNTAKSLNPISRIPGYNLDLMSSPVAETNTLQIRKYDTVTE